MITRIILTIVLALTAATASAAKPVWTPKFYGPYVAEHLSTYDGDTFWARVHIWPAQSVAIKIRLIGVDTPEIRGVPECEKRLGHAAQVFADQFLKRARPGGITLEQVKFDAYADRMDALVWVGGYNLTNALIDAGHGVPYSAGDKRGGWCDD